MRRQTGDSCVVDLRLLEVRYVSDALDMADDAVRDEDSTPDERAWSVRLLSVALRGINKGDEELPPTARGEANEEERLRRLKNMTLADRLEWRSKGNVAPVLIARRRAAALCAENPRDRVAADAYKALTEVAERLVAGTLPS